MKKWNNHLHIAALLVMVIDLGIVGGCDSGQNAIDEATGNRAVKQYHKMEKDLEEIADQQAERHGNIPDTDHEEDKK